MGPPTANSFSDLYSGTQLANFRFRTSTLSELFNGNFGIITIVFFIAGALLLIYTILGGISLMLSKGDPKSVAAGKSQITNGIVGFLIVFTAYWIVQLIGLLLGLGNFGGALT